ncbi:MAG: extracellular solute-binding protein, partial [Vallitaleaceae bacterium]|nr:extracellular solute-binding protein [Vallitaleaceae bacterium]
MKKVLSIVMLFVLVVSMTACASKKDEDTTTTETSTDSTATSTDASTSTDATAETEPVTIIMTNGKGEIDVQFQAAAAAFMETHPNITVEAYSVAVGDTVPIFEKLTSSGKTVTLAMLEPNAVLDKYADFGIDLTGEKWLEETVYGFTNPSGQVVGFPFAIEGMGLVYNQKVLDAAVGGTFDPFSIVTQDDLVALFDKVKANGIEFPIAYQTEGWSVANHFGSLFINQNEDPNKTVADIAAGSFDFATNETWNGYFNTMDILKDFTYNKYGERPVGTYYDDAHLSVGSGTSAMLFNGNWAYDSLKAVAGDEFGFIPVPVDNDPNNRLNGKLVAGPTQIFAINKEAS